MARQQTNKIIREENNTAKRREKTIHQGHFCFIVSLVLSSCVFVFVLFISPFERFGFSCVVQRGGLGVGRGPSGGSTYYLCLCLCNYIPCISIEEIGCAIIGLTV